MNRLLTLTLIGLAGLLASCGSSVSSSTQPGTNDVYTVALAPTQFTLNAGDWSGITATVDLSHENGAPKPVSPQPTIKFYSSDTRVSVSPAGEVCAGQWDTQYLTCTPASTLPTGYVTITAYNASHNVSATSLVSVHQRASAIALSVPTWGTRTCISQTPPNTAPTNSNQVQFVGAPVDASGNPVSNVFANDYTWIVADSTVASVSDYGFVIARNPGVTNVYAKLNGTMSAPLAFVTCPPSSIVLASSANTGGPPKPPFSTADLTMSTGQQVYLTANMVDTNGNPVTLAPLTPVISDPLTGSFSSVLPLTTKLTANTAGRFTAMTACEPSTCNNSVPDFVSPAGPTTGKAAGFGYPIYSNVIGVTVQGLAGSTVLVTGTTLTNGTTPSFLLLAYDSESMAVTHTVGLANIPNSMVVAPNGAKAYLGSAAGLVVVDLGTYQSTTQNFPIAGGTSTDVITGKVLGISPDSRYVLVSDTSDPNPANNVVFLIDTTGTKVAVRYAIPGINAVTFASDNSNMWIAGTTGVYTFLSDTFVKTSTNASTGVKALAWMPDGQSYFASGDQLISYSTCDDQNPVTLPLAGSLTGPINMSPTAIGGVPHALGLAGSQWLDYSVTTTAQIGNPTPQGDVCLSKVTVNAPVTAASGLLCTATQVSFSPTLEQEFVTGVDPNCASPESVIHGYDANTKAGFTLTTANPDVPLSGGVLNDGRKLYFGTWDSTAGTATLHRIDLSTGLGTPGTLTEDASASVEVVPSFVAVVPK